MTNIDSILKSRDITLPTKVCLVKTIIFPIVTYECESWSIKKAECQRITAFELWYWRRLLRVLDCKEIKPVNPKGNQSWIFFNTLATWCKKLTPWKRPWFWERLKTEGEGDNRAWGGGMVLPTWWAWVWASSRSWWWTGKPGVLQSMGLQRVRHYWVTELNGVKQVHRRQMTFEKVRQSFKNWFWIWFEYIPGKGSQPGKNSVYS